MDTTKNLLIFPVLTGALLFILQLLINVSFDVYSLKTGTISTGKNVVVHGDRYHLVTITNRSNSSIEELSVMLPDGLDMSMISTSEPIPIRSVHNVTETSPTQLLVFESINPMSEVNITYPASHQEITFPNHVSKNLELEKNNTVQGVVAKYVKDTFFEILPAIFILIFYYFLTKREVKSISKALVKSEQENQGITKKLEKLDKEVRETYETRDKLLDDLKFRMTKSRRILLATLRDYSKELDFWRGLVSKTYKLEKKTSRALFEQVTSSLQTHLTLSKSHEHEIDIVEHLEMLDKKGQL